VKLDPLRSFSSIILSLHGVNRNAEKVKVKDHGRDTEIQ
jgi:hypothetical protein